ncbi:ESCO1/2 acetyl-transferase-domain-containing protein [Tribonema minus]|uniref:ESCO1/2 acetyl-transferase-domain-containing protein n=1 Tax=Tribonema minus TaxID=303371 RepID=A0A836CNA6_9STRA|nr:ESCO1/2 acetyl-transferase-domain-containing protein [Tribonema minus]
MKTYGKPSSGVRKDWENRSRLLPDPAAAAASGAKSPLGASGTSDAGAGIHAAAEGATPTPRKHQMCLDLGQRDFGRRSQCARCGMLWLPSDPGDAEAHARHCAAHAAGVAFAGWKHERVQATFHGGGDGGGGSRARRSGGSSGGSSAGKGARVVEIRSGDPAAHVAKLSEVKALMDEDMGFAHAPMKAGRRAFLYITANKVAGCVIVEPITEGRHVKFIEEPALAATTPSPGAEDKNADGTAQKASVFDLEPTPPEPAAPPAQCMQFDGPPAPAMVGVHQMWTHRAHRKKGVMTRLLDTVRERMMFPLRVDRSAVAFSQPTQDGYAFACAYVAGDSGGGSSGGGSGSAGSGGGGGGSAGSSSARPLVYDIQRDE